MNASRTGYVKICGLTQLSQVAELVGCGADAIGINLIPSSKRAVSVAVARPLIHAVREQAARQSRRVECVGLLAPEDASGAGVVGIQRELSFDRVQLHSAEPVRLLEALGRPEWAFVAARIGAQADVDVCAGWPGTLLLVDAKVPGALGGSGHAFDWQLVQGLSAERPLLLAGGLTPENVAQAIRAVKPWGVDVASGVESGQPGVKDIDRCAAFVRAARAAFAAQGSAQSSASKEGA